jgi:chromosomal replication initiation ATPase DnaA
MTIWDEILTLLRRDVPPDDFRRAFSETAYASDSGDQITVWVPTESMRRHLTSRYGDAINSALTQIDRRGTHVRFVVTGVEEEDED